MTPDLTESAEIFDRVLERVARGVPVQPSPGSNASDKTVTSRICHGMDSEIRPLMTRRFALTDSIRAHPLWSISAV